MTNWQRLQLRRSGGTGHATIADHVVRPEDGGAEYDPRNLVAACHSCNFRRHHGNLGYRTGSPSPDAAPRNPLVTPLGAASQNGSLSRRGRTSREVNDYSLGVSRGLPHAFACHHHRCGPGPWQVKIIGWMSPGAEILDDCPPDCMLPKAR